MKIHLHRFIGFLLGLIATLCTTGCEEDIVAVRVDVPFTLYGVLSPETDTQRVRVFPVQETLTPLEPEPLDAAFISTDLATGEQLRWTDAILQEANGRYTHVFWIPLRVAYGHSYRLKVTRSDGAASTVEIDVPPRIELIEQVPILEAGSPVWHPVTVPLLADQAPRLRRVEVEYYIQVDFEDGPLPEKFQRIAFPYHPRRVDENWFIGINLLLDNLDIRAIAKTKFPINGQYGIKIIDITLRADVVSAEWETLEEGFDPYLLVQPGVLENVENGFGFVGSGYRYETIWIPPEEAMRRAIFRVD